MELPHSKVRQSYIDAIKIVEANLEEATSGSLDRDLLSLVQRRLDKLAEKYQYNEDLGSARYKLYELQAAVYYFEGRDGEALDFIDQAIATRGGNYERATKLKERLTGTGNGYSKSKRKKYVGLEGWLALFVVGVCLAILIYTISLVGYFSTFNDMTTIEIASPALASALSPLLWYEVLMHIAFIGLAIWLLVLFGKHRKLAKNVAMIYLLLPLLLGMIDLLWASSVFGNFNLSSNEPTASNGEWGRSLVAACIWIPYFAVSKRVKATLTE